MADIIDTLYANSQMLAPHITAPDTKEGLQHTVAMQRQQLDQMGRRHQGAFAAARRLVQRLTNRITRLEAKTTRQEAEINRLGASITAQEARLTSLDTKLTGLDTVISQIMADGTKMQVLLDELSEKLSQLELELEKRNYRVQAPSA